MTWRKINAAWMTLAALACLAAPARAAAPPPPSAPSPAPPRIWMVPLDQFRRSDTIPGTPDYMRLFATPPDPAWAGLLAHVSVWKLYISFAAEASDDQLRTVFGFLRDHRIALALEYGSLTTGKYCAGKVEGFGGEGLAAVARRFVSLGGTLDYLAMDEPLFYGHHDTFQGGCRAPIETLAADMAGNLATLRAIFPQVRVGDIEPGVVPDGDWPGEVAAFAQAFRAATGEDLAFLHLDMDWSVEWAPSLRRLADRAATAGVPLGVIYNGVGTDSTAAQWAAHIARNAAEAEDVLGHPPGDAVFQSWERWPVRALPPDDPSTATGILARYLRPRPTIAAMRTDPRTIAGTVTGPPGGIVRLEARGLGDDRAMLTIAGRIPPGASRALLAARFNAECGCSGAATLRLGPAQYRDDGGHAASRSFAVFRGPGLSLGTDAADDRVLRVEAQPGRIMSFNTPSFAVTPGGAFEARFALSMDTGDARVGYVAVIYLDEHDHELTRTVQLARSVWGEVATATTDRQGRFRLAVPPGAALGEQRLLYQAADDTALVVRTLP